MQAAHRFIGVGIALALTACGGAPDQTNSASAPAPPSVAPGDWPLINRDLNANRYSPLTEITTANVATLAPSWTYKLGGNSSAVPIVVAGVMYLPSRDRVVALDGDSGALVWDYVLPAPPPPPEGAARPQGAGRRCWSRWRRPRRWRAVQPLRHAASAYWAGDGSLPPRILFRSGANLIALDAATGTPAAGFGANGAVNVGVSYGGTPTVFENVAIIGAASGEVPQGPPGNPRAFDVRTGAKLWEFQTVPRAGERFNETWGDGWQGRGGTNMWGFATPIDSARGIAYLPIAGPAANYYGGDRPGNNVFGNSIVAVDARTGEYKWHFQTVHHDLWDTDMPSAGGLLEVERNGMRVPVIAHVGKSAYFYVLDRTTGSRSTRCARRPCRRATCRPSGTRRRNRFRCARRRSHASASAKPTSSRPRTRHPSTPQRAATS
jgi:quinoprotein glucose dehydrogenase